MLYSVTHTPANYPLRIAVCVSPLPSSDVCRKCRINSDNSRQIGEKFSSSGFHLDSEKTGRRQGRAACMRLICSIHDVCSSLWKFSYWCNHFSFSSLLDVGSNPSTFPCTMRSYEYIATLNHWSFSFPCAVARPQFLVSVLLLKHFGIVAAACGENTVCPYKQVFKKTF
jgi:hypothetical protein